MTDSVAIALIFPSLLGTYGDGGNASVLAQRLRWRGIDAEILLCEVGDAVPEAADIYVLGGGEDAAQTLAVSQLSDGVLARAVERNATVFAVCAGFQILGETFLDGRGQTHPGLGLIDCRTDRLDGPRAVGELHAQAVIDDIGELTGYENHGGKTTLGPDASPLARVISGVGNGAAATPGVGPAGSGTAVDGAIQGTVTATYLHGPALARNPALADWLLESATGRELEPLADVEESELRRERFAAVRARGLHHRIRRRQWRPSARG